MFNKIITMKKFILIAIASIFSLSFVNAQSYSLSWEGETYGDTVVISGAPDEEIVFHGILTNNSLDTDTIKIQRRLVYLMPDVSHYFCWSLCYMPNLDSLFNPPGYVVLESGQSSTDYDFAGHYLPNGVVGTSIVEYTFYNKNNLDEGLNIVAKYVTTPDGIDENILNKITISDVYPNPAINFVNMNYDLPREIKTATVKIVSLLGSVVMEQQVDVNNGNMRMNISNLDGGIYFYSFFVNGEMYSTKKLIVR